MKKILTIFDRDWEGNRGVINAYVKDLNFDFSTAIATEKLNGTNVRLTVRNHTLVRLEKRRNPSKRQKHQGIHNPWYVDADEHDPQDKYIWEAARRHDLTDIEEGEWSGEAVGPKIQGNPLQLECHVVCLFSYGEAPVLPSVPITYDRLREWLPKQRSLFGNGFIEGVVWHGLDGSMVKIKTKDFK